ncbi:ubiquitin fusion degradation protein I [Flagelloscypha sp. PMI_526]|nr:ubiquitin fusion degradation protein I [Flagelloscypha sp. PMI_526]
MAFFGPNGPGQLLAQMAGGVGQLAGGNRPPPRSYDEYLKAYSTAMLPTQRDNVSFGGKIIMPPSALANLTRLDLESPWMFKLRNPNNSAAITHAGVLEFIAQEGIVHLPYWMMKTLRLNEGDPIRITGTDVPKGKFVKLQAQDVTFLEVSDPKAVLEQALRNFTCLTQGDIIEITYNSIVFGFLVMETQPATSSGGISVLDTDLEVDFAAPVGYVEPPKPAPAAIPSMAKKLNLDLDSAISTPAGSRPGSGLSGGFLAKADGLSKGGEGWESFKGKGETLGGRKTKGKGISVRKADAVSKDSKIFRTDQHRVVSNATFEHDERVPAALNLPFGQLFFGFNVPTYVEPTPAEGPSSPTIASQPFSGSGATLNGRSTGSSSAAKGKGKEKENKQESKDWGSLGGGNTLGQAVPREIGQVGAGGARVPRPRTKPKEAPKRERSPTPDWGVDSDDDAIMVDSD